MVSIECGYRSKVRSKLTVFPAEATDSGSDSSLNILRLALDSTSVNNTLAITTGATRTIVRGGHAEVRFYLFPSECVSAVLKTTT